MDTSNIIRGQIGDGLVSGGIWKSGLIGDLAIGATDGGNKLLCSLIGPDFLQAVLIDNGCPNGVLLRNAFKTIENFCDFYNHAPPEIKKCLTDKGIQLYINLHGIIKDEEVFGICCAHCSGRIWMRRKTHLISFDFFYRFFFLYLRRSDDTPKNPPPTTSVVCPKSGR